MSFRRNFSQQMKKSVSHNLSKRHASIHGQTEVHSEKKRFFVSTSKHGDGRHSGNKDVQGEIRKKWVSSLEAAWEDAFKNMTTVQARQLAHKGRELQGSSNDLTYGEVNFSSLAQILCEDLQKHGVTLKGTFYDLGSGVGRGVIVAALVGSFDRIRGIEILPELFKASVDVLQEYKSRVAPQYSIPIPKEVIVISLSDLILILLDASAQYSDCAVYISA